jgi:GNAT superfamily N-acetyltransferase
VQVRFQQEFLYDVKADIQRLLQMHWEEIALNKDHIKLNPDWNAYENLEESGRLKIFTARSGEALVGYFVVLVGNNIHYKDHLFAVNDVIYLEPEYRKGMTGFRLIKAAEKWLKDDGVSVLSINTKVHKPFDLLLERLGFNLIERVYSKRLKDT